MHLVVIVPKPGLVLYWLEVSYLPVILSNTGYIVRLSWDPEVVKSVNDFIVLFTREKVSLTFDSNLIPSRCDASIPVFSLNRDIIEVSLLRINRSVSPRSESLMIPCRASRQLYWCHGALPRCFSVQGVLIHAVGQCLSRLGYYLTLFRAIVCLITGSRQLESHPLTSVSIAFVLNLQSTPW